MMESTIDVKHIDEFEEKAQTLYMKEAEAYWGLATTGEKHYEDVLIDTYQQINSLYSNQELFRNLGLWVESAANDPILKRKIQIIKNEMLFKQGNIELLNEISKLESEIESEYITFRAKINGTEVSDEEIESHLEKDKSSDVLKSYYEASKQIGAQVGPKVIELVKKRNELARHLGYRDYYSLALEGKEIKEEKLFALMSELDKQSERPFTEVKKNIDETLARRLGIAERDLKSWHYTDRFFQRPPSFVGIDLDAYLAELDLEQVTRDFYADMGMDIDSILVRSDLYPRKKKNQHAFCISIDRKQDIRVLCNNRPSAKWMGTMLHEYGHAVYDKYLGANLPFMLRTPAHTLTTEAIALLMERHIVSPEFLIKYAHIPESEVQQIKDALLNVKMMRLLVFTRWSLVMIHFERELYAHPEISYLNKFWWDLVEKYQLLKRPQGREEHADWAAKSHLATAPVYYQNYIMGEMMASQLLGSFCGTSIEESDELIIANKEAGELFKKNIFAPGARVSWNELIEQATGSKLSAGPFIRDLLGNVCVDHDELLFE